MDSLLVAVTALAVSIAVIPLMIHLAPHLELLDTPNARKIHTHPIPRVGGWGICTGTIAATLMWLELDPLATSFVIGALVLLLVGALDDMHDLPAMIKLSTQFVATLPAVIYAGLLINMLPPFSVWQIPSILAVPLTSTSLVLCINATNTSDGLDGLAAGATLLSLSGILYLAYISGSGPVMILTAASLGGLLGFFRYNTYPAIIFMGDLGSQFLGFAVGFLALALLHSGSGTISPWSLLLLTGLPVADIVVVATRRLIRGQSPFRPDKTHIHHRCLELGLSHTQAVALIYTLQASFVYFGVTLHSSPAASILLVYIAHLAVIYGVLSFVERRRSLNPIQETSGGRGTDKKLPNPALLRIPRLVLEKVVPLILVMTAALVPDIPLDFGILGAVLVIPLLLGLVRRNSRSRLLIRLPVFLAATALLYLYTSERSPLGSPYWQFEIAVMGILALLALIAVKFSPKRRKEEFRANSMDYLLTVFAILAVVALRAIPAFFNPYFLLYLPVLLYCCELLMIERRQRISWLAPAALGASAIMAVRGLVF